MADRRVTGEYVRQSAGYGAFVPLPLPPDPPLTIDSEMQALLSKADRALGRLDGSIQTLPNPDLFVLMYVRKEAVLSSQIEGTQASLNDVLAAEAQVLGGEKRTDAAEVINYVAAMNQGLERLATLPLSLRLIREIHERLMQGVRGQARQPGAFRTSQNWLGPEGATINEATYVPPPPGMVMDALDAFERFLHTDHDMPVLIKIGLIHAQFETIHPFLDGNGRVGRLLIAFLLCQREILTRPVLYLSHYLKRHRATYYERLQATRDHGDLEGWITFFLTGVVEVSGEATETARKIVDLRERHRSVIAADFGRVAGNGITVLERLFHRPIVTVKAIAELLGLSYPAANELVDRLERAGILVEITGHTRNRRYLYASYVSLFG